MRVSFARFCVNATRGPLSSRCRMATSADNASAQVRSRISRPRADQLQRQRGGHLARADQADEHRARRLAPPARPARPRRSCSRAYVAPVSAATPRAIASAHSAETTPCVVDEVLRHAQHVGLDRVA